MQRLSEKTSAMIIEAIEGLEILAVDRERLEWELVPFTRRSGGGMAVGWMVGISTGVPDARTGDIDMPFGILADPSSKEEVGRLVAALWAVASAPPDAAPPGPLTAGGLIIS